jgi:hypothetical protein
LRARGGVAAQGLGVSFQGVKQLAFLDGVAALHRQCLQRAGGAAGEVDEFSLGIAAERGFRGGRASSQRSQRGQRGQRQRCPQ